MFNKHDPIQNICYFQASDFLSLSPQVQLFFRLLHPIPGHSVLSIGAESHEILKACQELNLDIYITEPDKKKMILAQREFGNKISYYHPQAHDLPFDDNTFDYSFFFNSLGYTKDPVKALEESFRVTKNYVFIGITNRYTLKGFQQTIKDFLYPPSQKYRLFSVFEIKQIIKDLLGDVPVKWRTLSTLDFSNSTFMKNLGYTDLIQKTPFGNFAGICVHLTPKFRLTPLKLEFNKTPRIKRMKTAAQRSVEWKQDYFQD